MSRSGGKNKCAGKKTRTHQGRGRDLSGREDCMHITPDFSRGRGSPRTGGLRRNHGIHLARSPISFIQSSVLGDWNTPQSASLGRDSGNTDSRRNSRSRARGGSTLNKAVCFVYPGAGPSNENTVQQDLTAAEIIVPASGGSAAVFLDRTPMGHFELGGSLNPNQEGALHKTNDLDPSYPPVASTVGSDQVHPVGFTRVKIAGHQEKNENSIKMSRMRRYRKDQDKVRNINNDGFLCIGGVRIYTNKALDWCEGQDEFVGGEEGLSFAQFDQRRRTKKKYKPKFRQVSSDTKESEDCENFSSTDVNEDIAEDYVASMEGDFMDMDLIVKTPSIHQVPVEDMGDVPSTSQESLPSSDDSNAEEDLGYGADLLQAMLLSGNDSETDIKEEDDVRGDNFNLESLKLECSSDDGEGTIQGSYSQGETINKMAMKQRLKQMKAGNFGQLQPVAGTTSSKKKNKPPGSKKWQRTEMIARKRQERAVLRGFDLATINAKLESIVLNNVDMFAFEPMNKTDCLQVQKLASVYRLKSGSQGSGKKRFVMVMRTVHTSFPTGLDKARLEEMLRFYKDEDSERTSLHKREGEQRRLASKAKRATRLAFQSMKGGSILKQDRVSVLSSSSKKSTRKSVKKAANYASQPLSFVSRGTITSRDEDLSMLHTAEVLVADDICLDDAQDKPGLGIDGTRGQKFIAGSLCIGQFEAHTKGFGSRMLAKMGYMEGSGLGKDNQGIPQALQAIKRPKSLGLGA